MKDIKNLTLIELNNYAAELKIKHENCKSEIIQHTKEIEDIELMVNNKLNLLSEIEDEYVKIIEEVQKR